MSSQTQLGIGSFAYRYAVGFAGFAGFAPPEPMDVCGFLHATAALGLKRAQLCENLRYADLPVDELTRVRETAGTLGIDLELGMNGLAPDSFSRHLELAGLLGASFLRIVLGSSTTRSDAVETISRALPELGDRDLHIGIENHFDLGTKDLVSIVDELDHPRVGMIFDSTNALGFAEKPRETLALMGARIVSAHIKDYRVMKVEAGYLISGATLGEGSLGFEQILTALLEANPLTTLILEMTIRRDDSWPVDRVIAWERDAIKRSADALRDMTARLRKESARRG